jgi:glycosyltransferase involved in cell wall biosynthesis/SAM-dependent methyltransferase
MANGRRNDVRFKQPLEKLAFTGERFTSGLGGEIEHEHRHRYLFAAGLCSGKVVVDVASGEGYGSAFLSQFAERVVGVDFSADAVRFATANYKADNLSYVQASAACLPLATSAVDVVVSFETIEHFHDHDAFMSEVRRVLRPGGLLVISSPNKGIYNGGEDHNHFHVRELTRDQFLDLIGKTFPHVRSYEQKATTGSLLVPDVPRPDDQFRTYRRADDYGYDVSNSLTRGVYTMAVASDRPLPATEWGALDDEGYVGFLSRWIQDADQRHAAALADSELRHAATVSDLEVRLAQSIGQAQQLKRVLADRDRRIEALTADVVAYRTSTSWRLSAPIRWGGWAARLVLAEGRRLPRRIRQVFQLARFAQAKAQEVGALEAAKRATRALRPDRLRELVARAGRHVPGQAIAAPTSPPLVYPSPTQPAPKVLARRILLVAELSLPQCAKYRVWQKKEHFNRLGIPCTVIDWGRKQEVYSLLQTHSAVIFYRVPGWPDTLGFMHEARRLGMPSFWEVDDLIFDAEAYTANRNLDHVPDDVRRSVLAGIPLYRAALQACEYGLASTSTLARSMQAAGVKQAFVIENALDAETLRVADQLQTRVRRERAAGDAVIIYGSGSTAHDADFLQAADAVLEVMRRRPGVRFRVVGDLQLPTGFAAVADRVERLPKTDFATYLERLWEADISLAPLEDTVFNDAKSNIKYLEAAVVGLPSVCSPRAAFREVIEDGRTGFLAQGADAWTERLLTLCDDPSLAREMGARARAAVLARYTPDAVARQQVARVVEVLGAPVRSPLNVLTANVFFKPQSFGGATIVAEEVAQRLATRGDTQVAVFTSLGQEREPYTLLRYEAGGLNALAVRVPERSDRALEHRNERMRECFAEALAAFRPDVVHLHCLQGISASIAQACLDAGVPYVVTIHDAWWLCERQFMVREEGKYCFQTKIDLKVCATCVPDIEFTLRRGQDLRPILLGARLLLTPSEFHRQLHIANGIEPARIRVNRNGVRMPKPGFRRTEASRLCFGFVGGVGPIKGIDLIRQAFLEIDRDDYELTLVDNTLNLGFSSVKREDWSLRGGVRIQPAYKQSELDDFFGNLDVLLFPSQWKESFGLTVREALARDVWVIATDAGGVVEDIVDGVNGTIIPMGSDHGPLRSAILDLLQNRGRLAGYRNPHAGRITTYDGQAEELHGILREVISARKAEDADRCADAVARLRGGPSAGEGMHRRAHAFYDQTSHRGMTHLPACERANPTTEP